MGSGLCNLLSWRRGLTPPKKTVADDDDDSCTSTQEDQVEKLIVLGDPKHNFWLYSDDDGFDLTRPKIPYHSTTTCPRLRLETVTNPITINPERTAMVIVDMQNYTLSQPRNKHNVGHDVEKVLITRAIPAARKANVQVVWLNWGLSERDVRKMPPSLQRIFAFDMDGTPNLAHGIGSDIGPVTLEDDDVVDGGRFLMRDQWNTALHAPLEKLRRESLTSSLPDKLIYKNRICGMADGSSSLNRFLKSRGITTLLFGGVNVEFCVLSTMAAANLKGYDTILLSDCANTTNGKAPMDTSLQMTKKGWGFCSSAKEFEKGVENLDR